LLSEPAIFLAALGITTLELVETAAVALALHAHSGKNAVYLYAALGTIGVFVPMFILGALITLLPDLLVKLTAGVLLLYFAQRLTRSARRSVLNARKGSHFHDEFHRGTMATAFSVGAIEAFEAAIVLVGLLPNGFQPTVLGMASGIGVVVVSTYLLRDQVRKVKQADMKIAVSALLFSFATFWIGEALVTLDDLILIPLFAFFLIVVYKVATESLGQRCLVYHLSAGGIDDEGVPPHQREPALVDQMPGLGGKGDVEGDDVGGPKEGVEVDHLAIKGGQGLLGDLDHVISQEPHPEHSGYLADTPAYPSHPDDAQGLPSKLYPDEALLIPPTRLHRGVRRRDAPGEGEH
jgi:uncharacterized membrane protein